MKNKVKYLLILTLFTIPFFAFTCGDKVEGGHKHILFINNSENSVHVLEEIKTHLTLDDTLFTCGGRGWILQKGEDLIITSGNNYWETDFKSCQCYQLFIFSQRFSSSYCHDEENIKEFSDKYLLKRYQLTKEDLDRMNWRITYP
jgi:hypothetical protein